MTEATNLLEGAKHTPGPWAHDASSGAIYYADGDVEPLIASTNLEGVSVEQADADGALIAAAPDLFNALGAMVAHYTALVNSGDAGHWNPETDIPVKAARAALAKAQP